MLSYGSLCSVMGRELTDLHMEKKPNGVAVVLEGVSHGKPHVASEISEDSSEAKDYEVKECTEENSVVDQCHEKQEVLGFKSTNVDTGGPDGKAEKPGTYKSGDNKTSSSTSSKSAASLNLRTYTVPQPFSLATEKRGLCTHTVGTENAANGVSYSPKTNNKLSPRATKNSQVIKILVIGKVIALLIPFLGWYSKFGYSNCNENQID